MPQLRTVKAKINYYPPDGPNVFYPGTAGYQRRNFDTKDVQIADVRGAEDNFDLDKNGFQIVNYDWTEFGVDDPDQQVRDIVYRESIEMLKKLCVDKLVHAGVLGLRSSSLTTMQHWRHGCHSLLASSSTT